MYVLCSYKYKFIRACLINKVEKYFFHLALVFIMLKTEKYFFIPGLKESDAYPAEPEDGYGWEKLFSRENV